MSDFFFAGYFVVAMYAGALVAKALGAVVVFALALTMVYPDANKATFLFLLFVPAVVLAAFRD
jgi:hypothetical protein